MTSKTPPVPQENQSPFPIEEAPHEEGEAIAVARELSQAKERWSPNAKQIGIGAAVGVGSAAVVAAMLYWGNRKPGK